MLLNWRMEWLKAFLKAADKKPADLARALDIPRSRVSEMMKGDRRLQPDEVAPTAELVGVSTTRIVALMSGLPDPGDPATAAPRSAENTSSDGQTFHPQPLRDAEGRPDVPVWASAEAGADGAMILTAEPIDYIRRSERMQGVKNPFAFYIIGASMSPVIEHGDQVVVNPGLPVKPGADCVFVQDDGHGTMRALVKRLLSSKPEHWRVRQYNPPRDYDLPKKKWPKAFTITEKRYG